MKALLTLTAAIEAGTGVALAIAPSMATVALLGSPIDSPAGPVVGRVLGGALFSIGMACWTARDDARGRTASGVVAAMLFYNLAVALLLVHAFFGLGLRGIGLWPAVILHSALAAWCVADLRLPRNPKSS